MRFFAPILAVLASVAVAQDCTANCINVPNGGLVVTAGQPITLTWSNPTNSKLTIKLQNGVNITPTSGTTLITGIDASAGTYTVTIPSDLPPSSQYVFETIDEDNTSIYNFSPPFSISGATAAVSSSATATGSTASTASTGSASTGSSTMTATASSASSSNSSESSSASTASRTSSQSASRTSSSAMSSATTTVPNGNGATSMKVEGAMLALVAGVAALL